MPQSSKQTQLVRNISYGILSWVLPIVPTLVAMPIVLRKLGNEQYGILTVFLGFISYFFTTAIGKVAGKYAAEFLSSGEENAISPVISATLIVSTLTALASTAAAALAAGFIVDEVLWIRGDLRNDAVIGVYLASATVLTTAAAQTFILLLQGLHRFDRYFLLANFTSVSFSVGGLVLALLGFGFVSILIWNLATWVIAGIAAFFFAKMALPRFTFTLRIPREIWHLVIRYAAGIVGYQLFGNVLLLFERGWVTRYFGPEAVAFYNVPMILAMYVHAFVAALVVSIFPTLNELLAEPKKLLQLYRHSTKLVLWMVVFATVTAAVAGRAFLTVYLKNPAFAEMSSGLLAIHTVTFSILALNTIAWHMAEGFRASSINAYVTLAWMVTGIALIVLLSPHWSITGVGVARLIGVLPFLPMILIVERRFLGGIGWSFWGSALSRLAAAGILAAGVEWLVLGAFGVNWPSIIAAFTSGGLMYLAVSLLTKYVSTDELAGLGRYIRGRRTGPEAV
jgi:O-antigen/teichoic acid export membrane protein